MKMRTKTKKREKKDEKSHGTRAAARQAKRMREAIIRGKEDK
jgi:hypothetical protein